MSRRVASHAGSWYSENGKSMCSCAVSELNSKFKKLVCKLTLNENLQ